MNGEYITLDAEGQTVKVNQQPVTRESLNADLAHAESQITVWVMARQKILTELEQLEQVQPTAPSLDAGGVGDLQPVELTIISGTDNA